MALGFDARLLLEWAFTRIELTFLLVSEHLIVFGQRDVFDKDISGINLSKSPESTVGSRYKRLLIHLLRREDGSCLSQALGDLTPLLDQLVFVLVAEHFLKLGLGAQQLVIVISDSFPYQLSYTFYLLALLKDSLFIYT